MSATTSPAPAGTATGRTPVPGERISLSRVIGFVGLLSLVLVLASVAALVLLERSRLLAQVERETANDAFFLADHASRLFEAADFTIRQAQREIDGRSWDEVQGAKPLWDDLHDLAEALPYVEAIWLNDSTGALRLTTFAFPTPASNVSDRDFFTANRQPGEELYVSHLIVGRITQRPTFLLSRRLEQPDGTFRGIASVTAEIDYFRSFWKLLQLRFEPRVTLFRDKDFDVLAQYPEPADGVFQPVEAGRLVEAIGAGSVAGTLPIGERTADGLERFLSYHRVGNLPLYLSVSVRRDAIDAEWLAQIMPYALFGGAAVLALGVLAAFAFRQARRDVQANALLRKTVEERTADLTAAKAQLETLFDELNHRVKNNLQVVTSLLRLEAQRIGDPRLRASLDESVQRIQAMALLHRQLSHVVDVSGISFPAYLRELARTLAEAYGAEERIAFEVECDDIGLSTERATPLALVVNEVVSNALKYAFPDGRRGRLRVCLTRQDGHCLLSVEDDGVGFPPDLDWRKAGGLGLRIVRALGAQLGGTPDFAADGGTRFTLRFPLEGGTDGRA